MNSQQKCPLCSKLGFFSQVTNLKRVFHRCPSCDLLFVDPSQILSQEEEKKRYESHNNDIEDIRYQDFLRPLFRVILEAVPKNSKGLDFGAGPGPALSEMLKKKDFEIELYDPFFWPNENALNTQYDFVFASEVVEHFSNPNREFRLLRSLLKPKGKLFLMTLLYGPEIDLTQWYYLKDPTHICAYSKNTFNWIQSNFGFTKTKVQEPRIVSLFA
ncbi:MAG: class I SAM-dependent methyltransferase [Proteobacteria bacterium]|jgi:SAM-dependent methyltransferase|nr:class I SAM-dependent methyltransferase [Pseudomonadota bacterium]